MAISPIYKTLQQDPVLLALLGDRIFPNKAPLGTNTPYLVWQGLGSDPANNLDCGAKSENSSVQFVVWHKDIRKAEEIRLAASKVLEAAGFYYLGEHPDNEDEEAKLHGRGWDMNWWSRR